MSHQNDEQALRNRFSEQARADRRHAPALEETLGRPHVQTRLALGRLAAMAGLFLLAGIIGAAAFRGWQHQPIARQQPLPDLLDGLDLPTLWQSPTAFLLEMSLTTSAESEPEPNSQGPDSRQSNG